MRVSNVLITSSNRQITAREVAMTQQSVDSQPLTRYTETTSFHMLSLAQKASVIAGIVPGFTCDPFVKTSLAQVELSAGITKTRIEPIFPFGIIALSTSESPAPKVYLTTFLYHGKDMVIVRDRFEWSSPSQLIVALNPERPFGAVICTVNCGVHNLTSDHTRIFIDGIQSYIVKANQSALRSALSPIVAHNDDQNAAFVLGFHPPAPELPIVLAKSA